MLPHARLDCVHIEGVFVNFPEPWGLLSSSLESSKTRLELVPRVKSDLRAIQERFRNLAEVGLLRVDMTRTLLLFLSSNVTTNAAPPS